MIRLHLNNGFIRAAFFLCKNIFYSLLISLYSEICLFLNSLCKEFASLFFQIDFEFSPQLLLLPRTSWYANSDAVTYTWCFVSPLTLPRSFIKLWIHVSCNCYKVSCILFSLQVSLLKKCVKFWMLI